MTLSSTLLLNIHYSDDHIEKNEKGGTCSTYEGEERCVYRAVVGKLEGKEQLGRPRRRWENNINALKPELNSICYLLALLRAHHFLHVSRIRGKLLTFRLLMS